MTQTVRHRFVNLAKITASSRLDLLRTSNYVDQYTREKRDPRGSNTVRLQQEATELVRVHLEPQQRSHANQVVEDMVAKADHILGVLGDARPNSVVLVALALDRQFATQSVLWASRAACIAALKLQIPRLRVIEAIAEGQDLASNAAQFYEVATLATEFLDAIAPRSPAALTQKPKQLNERVLWFLSLRSWPDAAVVAQAEKRA